MSVSLVSPDSSAPLCDWQAWLAELQEMPKTSAVTKAINRAQQMLRSHKKRKPASPRRVDKHRDDTVDAWA